MKKSSIITVILLLISFALGILVLFLLLRYQINTSKEAEFHEHADFALFIEGEAFDFSDTRYMTMEPCMLTPQESVPIDEKPLEDSVHLHNNDGSVIHVHRPGITYSDFFESLGMRLEDDSLDDADGNEFKTTDEKSFTFMLNGEMVDSLANAEIRNLDQVLISYGDAERDSEVLMSEYGSISNKSCISSEACLHREPAAPENCSQTPKPFLLEGLGL